MTALRCKSLWRENVCKISLILCFVFLFNCSGLGPAQFLTPDSLNADTSRADGVLQDSEDGPEDFEDDSEAPQQQSTAESGESGTQATLPVDSVAAENPGTFTLEPKSFDVAIDGQNHEITITEDSIVVDGMSYAIPEDYQDQNQVISLSAEQILSGESPFGQSAATVTGEDEASVPEDDAELNEPITVAQLPAPMPKDESEPATEEENTSSTAAPVTHGEGWSDEESEAEEEFSVNEIDDFEDEDGEEEFESPDFEHPEMPQPPKGSKSAEEEPTVYLVPNVLLSPCSSVEDSDLPPVLKNIRSSTFAESSKSGANDPDCTEAEEEEDRVTPLSCIPTSNPKTGKSSCKWQVLVKQPKTKTPRTPSTTVKPKIPPIATDTGMSLQPAGPVAVPQNTPLPDMEITLEPVPGIETPVQAAPAPKTVLPVNTDTTKTSPSKTPLAY